MESYTRVHDQTTVNTRHIVIEHRLSARAHRPNSEQGETDNACVHNALQGPLAAQRQAGLRLTDGSCDGGDGSGAAAAVAAAAAAGSR